MSKVNLGIESSSWINIAAGIAVIAVAYYEATTNAALNTVYVGGSALILIGAFTAWAAATGRTRTTMWPAIASVVVGAGLAIYPWFAVDQTTTFVYAISAAGVVAAVVSAYEVWALNNEPSRASDMMRPSM